MSTTTGNASPELKHLRFVRIAAIQVFVLAASLYDYVKRNAGPLRSVLGSIEGSVCDKYKNLPDHLLVFTDRKVDEALHQFDKHAPSVAKEAALHIHHLVIALTEKGGKLLSEIKSGGPVTGFYYVISEVKHTSISLIAIVYLAADGYKPVHTLAELVLPTAGYWSKKYNNYVIKMSRKGHKIFRYVPQIPIDELSQACNKQRTSKATQNGSTEHKEKASSSSDSD